MSAKSELLEGAETEFQGLKRAIAGLSEADMREVWCGTWSVREILAHISGWHREMLPGVERLARGEKPFTAGVSYSDFDAWNAKFAAAKATWTTADIVKELDAAHADFLCAAGAVPEDRVVPERTAYKLVDGNSRNHYAEHARDVAAWRKSRGR
jgi:hypothetical protein